MKTPTYGELMQRGIMVECKDGMCTFWYKKQTWVATKNGRSWSVAKV